MNAPKISGKKVVIVPILRAGLGMVDGLATLWLSIYPIDVLGCLTTRR